MNLMSILSKISLDSEKSKRKSWKASLTVTLHTRIMSPEKLLQPVGTWTLPGSVWSLKLFGISIWGLSTASFKDDHLFILKTYNTHICVRGISFHCASRYDATAAGFLDVSRSLRCDVTDVTWTTSPFTTACNSVVCLCLYVVLLLFLWQVQTCPSVNFMGGGSCVTLSDWWLPYLVQSAAHVPGVGAWRAWTRWVIDSYQCDISACCEFTIKHLWD